MSRDLKGGLAVASFTAGLSGARANQRWGWRVGLMFFPLFVPAPREQGETQNSWKQQDVILRQGIRPLGASDSRK